MARHFSAGPLARYHRLLLAMALCLVVTRPANADPLTDRIAESNAAAQAHQGPFDGAWVLAFDTNKAVLYKLQMTDPPDASGTIVGAWSDVDGRMGAARITRRGAHEIDLLLDAESSILLDAKPAVRARLFRRSHGWAGHAPDGVDVTLTPSLASGKPPV